MDLQHFFGADSSFVIHDPELADVLEGIKVVQISDIHLQGGIGDRERGAGKSGDGFAQSQDWGWFNLADRTKT